MISSIFYSCSLEEIEREFSQEIETIDENFIQYLFRKKDFCFSKIDEKVYKTSEFYYEFC
jgi:hypothetical protein